MDTSKHVHYVCKHCFYMVLWRKHQLDAFLEQSKDPKTQKIPCPNCGTESEKTLEELLKEMEGMNNE